MIFSEARQGRVFILRLEDGDVVHEPLRLLLASKGFRQQP
jgi:hypothetical protein